MKTPKKALVTELTTFLAPLLPTLSSELPKGISQAVEQLAESILRWRAKQERPTRALSFKSDASESNALARLMDSRLHEQGEEEQPEGHTSAEAAALTAAAVAQATTEPTSTGRRRRTRLGEV